MVPFQERLRFKDSAFGRIHQVSPLELVPDWSLTVKRRAQLHLRYAFGHAQMVVYFPFLHYASQPNAHDNPAAMECCRKCIRGAMTAVQTAEMLDSLGMFNEAYPLTLQVLAFAATALLVVEMSIADIELVHRAQIGSRRARALLAKLSMSSVAAAQLLSSLQVCLRRHTDTDGSSS